MTDSATVRLAHISDVHFTAKPLGWKGRDLVSKRLTGWVNVTLLGRGFRFRHAPAVAELLVRELKDRKFDHVVFSGDATTLGFESEFASAAKLLGVDDPDMPPGLAVPGNHDCYVKKPVRERLFERLFRPLAGRRTRGWRRLPVRPKGRPALARRREQQHLQPSDLRRHRPRRAGAARTVAAVARKTPAGAARAGHALPVRRSHGQAGAHRLKDWRETAKVAADGGVRLWLHGHRHRPYHLGAHAEVPFPSVCGGSATQTGLWGYHDYTIEKGLLKAVRRAYDFKTQAFVDRETFELALA